MDDASLYKGGDERLYECLAEYLEYQEGRRAVEPDELLRDDPEAAAVLADYLDAVDEVDRFAAPLREFAVRYWPSPAPATLGHYELLEEIGRGGSAVVYRARQTGLNRTVAVKMVRGDRPGAYDTERMRFEAEAVAQLEHPGIVPIYEIGEHEGLPFFSMKLYAGGNLASRAGEFLGRPLEAAQLVEAIAHAVHHAHQRGILHRDLKPSNILLDTEGRPHVADFGLAKRFEADQELTRTGELIGTPAYIAPERISLPTTPATTATDVYGLGAILYVLITGRPPFTGASPLETLLDVRSGEAAPPSRLNSRVDRDLDTICLKCLEKEPARRYVSALEMAEDLRRWRSGEPIAARQIGRLERLHRWTRRNPVLATAGAAAIALATIGLLGLSAGYVLLSRANNVAERHREDAERKAAELGLRLYAAQMSLGFRHLERGELDELRILLDEFRDQDEIKGFEWHWLNGHAQSKPREMVRFTGHRHIIYGGAFSPDGAMVATCGTDATIQLWDSATGKLHNVLETGAGRSAAGQKLDENCVRFSPDGKLLASVCEDGSVRLWTLSDGIHRNLVPAPQQETLSVEFSADGRWLLTASVDGRVRVWDVGSQSLVREFAEYRAPAKWAVFSPDGREVASIDQGGNLLVWDCETGRVRLRLQAGVNTHCIAYSPDGAFLATEGPDRTVVLWNAATGERAARLPAHGGIRSLDFSRDAARLACSGNDGSLRIWSIPDRQLRQYFKAHTSVVWAVRFAPGGDRVLTVGSDWTARVWEVPLSAPKGGGTSVTTPLRHVVFAPDSRSLLLVTRDGEVRIGEATMDGGCETLPVSARSHAGPVFSPDGREVAFIGTSGAVQRWSLSEERLLAPFQPPPLLRGMMDWQLGATQLAYLDENRLAALTSRGSLLLCESGQWRECQPGRSGDGHARMLASVAGGRLLALCDLDPSRIELWNVEQNRFEPGIVGDSRLETGVVSPDERWLACGQGNGTIEVIELQASDRRKVLIGHREGVSALAFSADGRTLASASLDGTARLWNVATGMELSVLESRPHGTWSVAFSPDGGLLAIGGDPRVDGTTLSIYHAGREK